MMNKVVAIDIGFKFTKVLEADFNKAALEILNIESFKTPYLQEADIDDKLFFAQLYKIIPASRLKTSDLAISVPSSVINFAILELPKMPKEDLNKVVLREAKRKILPAPQDTDIFNYTVLGEKKEKESPQLNILAGAGKHDIISKYIELFKKEDIVPSLVTSAPLALMSYFTECRHAPEENSAFIDIGFKNTSMVIFAKGQVALIRNIPFASSDFILQISKKTGMSFDKTEELFAKGEIKEDLFSDNCQYLVAELRRSFAYYKEITAGQRIDSIIFSGGMMKTGHFFEFFKKNMGGNLGAFDLASCRYITAKKFSRDELSSRGPEFAVALGLALALKPAAKTVLNFLPPEIPQEKKIKQIKIISLQALAVLISALMTVTVIINIRNEVIASRLKNLSKNFSQDDYDKILKKFAEINVKVGSLEKQKKLFGVIARYRLSYDKLFELISTHIPDNTFIKDISVSYEKPPKVASVSVKMKLAILGDYELAKNEADIFYKRLLESGFFLSLNFDPPKFEGVIIKNTSQGNLTDTKEREFNIDAAINAK